MGSFGSAHPAGREIGQRRTRTSRRRDCFRALGTMSIAASISSCVWNSSIATTAAAAVTSATSSKITSRPCGGVVAPGHPTTVRRGRHPHVTGTYRNGRQKTVDLKNKEEEDQVPLELPVHREGRNRHQVAGSRRITDTPSIQGRWRPGCGTLRQRVRGQQRAETRP